MLGIRQHTSYPRVYTFSPCFRAERGRTRRHLSEFWMVEAEMAFLEDIGEVSSHPELSVCPQCV